MADVTSGLQWAETAVSEKQRKIKEEKTIILVSGNSCTAKEAIICV